MTDWEPTTDLPDRIDPDDTPVESSARARDERLQRRRKRILLAVVVALGLGLLAAGFDLWRVLIAVAVMYLIFRAGFAVIGALARPVPEPPPPGDLRRVRMTYRCNECGAELRMTLASEETPEPPRHCSGAMELTGTRDDGL